ncbi:hypothetical protein GBA52_003593 [Prunus armeniaca]|nr:hypothetical protein GBA52_003593 [Prunus armeniaca]
MDIHASLKSASPLGSLRANIPWFLGCFVLGTCSFPAALHMWPSCFFRGFYFFSKGLRLCGLFWSFVRAKVVP